MNTDNRKVVKVKLKSQNNYPCGRTFEVDPFADPIPGFLAVRHYNEACTEYINMNEIESIVIEKEDQNSQVTVRQAAATR